MRILYHSAAPWVSGGYGRVTQEVTTRLQNETDHEVAVQCLSSIRKNPISWHGEVWNGDEFVTPVELEDPITVFPSSSSKANTHFGVKEAKEHYEEFDADFYFTHFDTWMSPAREAIPQMDVPYGSYVIVDHYPCPVEVVEQVSGAYEIVAMSRFAKKALGEKGVRSRYIPHGVDTDKYRPIDKDERVTKLRTNKGDENEEIIDLSDKFVFGMIAANYADRKNIPHHMQAFDMFLRNVDDEAIMYMHMHQSSNVGYDLYRIQKEIGIPDENIVWVPPDLYHDVGDATLAAWYNNMDVLLNSSMGESWGLTITEAMSCGTPAIVTNFSSMAEQVGIEDINPPLNSGEYSDNSRGGFEEGSHGLAVNPITSIWREKVSSKQYITPPKDIYDAMYYYYHNPDLVDDHGERARDYVVENYGWKNSVVPEFIQMFDELEEILV